MVQGDTVVTVFILSQQGAYTAPQEEVNSTTFWPGNFIPQIFKPTQIRNLSLYFIKLKRLHLKHISYFPTLATSKHLGGGII